MYIKFVMGLHVYRLRFTVWRHFAQLRIFIVHKKDISNLKFSSWVFRPPVTGSNLGPEPSRTGRSEGRQIALRILHSAQVKYMHIL